MGKSTAGDCLQRGGSIVVNVHGTLPRGDDAVRILATPIGAPHHRAQWLRLEEPLSAEIYEANYREATAAATDRFRDWLEEALVKGLGRWRDPAAKRCRSPRASRYADRPTRWLLAAPAAAAILRR
ncbi:MAG: hypothetical protein U1E76_24540 [Planctomycetota bacterium]